MVTTHLYMEHADDTNKQFNKKLIQQLIINPISQLLKEEKIEQLPSFVNKFKVSSAYTPIINELMIETLGTMSAHDLYNVRIAIANEIIAVSNEISQQAFITYLHNNPHIKVVFGLVGANHLPFLTTIGTTTILNETKVDHDSTEFYWEGHYHIKLKLENQCVDVHLFGGMHDDSRAYVNMLNYLKLHLSKEDAFSFAQNASLFSVVNRHDMQEPTANLAKLSNTHT